MVRPDYCAVDHLQAGIAATTVVEGFEEKLPQARQRPAPELTVNRRPFAKMLVQIAPGNTGARDPENPIQNKPMILRTPPAARPALDHERLKAGPFLVTHQSPDHGSLLKSYRESETTPFGNPLCQHILRSCRRFNYAKIVRELCMSHCDFKSSVIENFHCLNEMLQSQGQVRCLLLGRLLARHIVPQSQTPFEASPILLHS
jgi:hypothetical protein